MALSVSLSNSYTIPRLPCTLAMDALRRDKERDGEHCMIDTRYYQSLSGKHMYSHAIIITINYTTAQLQRTICLFTKFKVTTIGLHSVIIINLFSKHLLHNTDDHVDAWSPQMWAFIIFSTPPTSHINY